MSRGYLFGGLWLFVLLLGIAPIDSVVAEGRCPPGQYPIGDQEWAAVLPSLGQAGARLMRIPGTGSRHGVLSPARLEEMQVRPLGIRPRLRQSAKRSSDAGRAELPTAQSFLPTTTSAMRLSGLHDRTMA